MPLAASICLPSGALYSALTDLGLQLRRELAGLDLQHLGV